MGYGQDGRAPNPGSGKRFSLLHSVQIGSGAHPTSYAMGTRGSFTAVKRQGREADHLHPSSSDDKDGGSITPFPHISS
jgi:hypothetical protein